MYNFKNVPNKIQNNDSSPNGKKVKDLMAQINRFGNIYFVFYQIQ